jgi:hypothetical protein
MALLVDESEQDMEREGRERKERARVGGVWRCSISHGVYE